MSLPLALADWPRPESPFSRRDPRWRLAALLLAGVAVSAVRSVPAAALGLGFALLLTAIARLPFHWTRRRLGELLFALAPLVILLPVTAGRDAVWYGWLRFSPDGAWLALTIVLKGVALCLIALVLLATAPLPTTLAAAHRLRVPGRLVHVTLLTYRYLFVLAEEFRRLRTALRARGFRPGVNRHTYRTFGQLTGTLLVHGSERAERVAAAMACRGFDGTFRTLAEFRTSRWDVLMLLLIVGASVGVVAADWWRPAP